MKKIILFLMSMLLLSSLSANNSNTKENKDKIQILQNCASISADVTSYGNTIYEAICSVSKVDYDKIDVYINKYKDGIYDSTLRIDIPKSQFSNIDFNLNYQNEHVRLFVIEENDICVFLFSDKIINFLRIKNDKIVNKKTYELNQNSSILAKITFNGKDRFYFSQGSNNSNIISFDLEGNIIKNKILKLNQTYNLYLYPTQDYVYGILKTFYSKQTFSTVIKFNKDLDILDYYPYNLNEENSPSHINGLSSTENNLYIQCSYYGKTSDEKSKQYYVKLTPEKENIVSYYLDFDDTFHILNKFFNNDDINLIGFYMSTEDYLDHLYYQDNNSKVKMVLLNIDKDLNITEYEYPEETRFYDYNVLNFNDNIFMSGTYVLKENYSIKKVAYNNLFSEKKQIKSKNTIIKADIKPFEETEKYLETKKQISKTISLIDSIVNEIDSKVVVKKIKLKWSNVEPDDEKVLSNIPVFHDGNEGR